MLERIHKDRGRVLLAIRIHSVWWTLFLWAVVAVWLAAEVLTNPRWSRLGNGLASGSACVIVLLRYLLYPKVKFYEHGIELPPTRDNDRSRYLRWDQIERASWDGDRLVLTGINSVLAGGPVQGGAVRIPHTQHLSVDQILGKNAAAG